MLYSGCHFLQVAKGISSDMNGLVVFVACPNPCLQTSGCCFLLVGQIDFPKPLTEGMLRPRTRPCLRSIVIANWKIRLACLQSPEIKLLVRESSNCQPLADKSKLGEKKHRSAEETIESIQRCFHANLPLFHAAGIFTKQCNFLSQKNGFYICYQFLDHFF